MKSFQKKLSKPQFHAIYWRQFIVTSAMIFLSLAVLSVSFFSISYNILNKQNIADMEIQTKQIASLASHFVEDGHLSKKDTADLILRSNDDSSMDLLLYSLEDHSLLVFNHNSNVTDVTLPSRIVHAIESGLSYSGLETIDDLSPAPVYIVATPIADATTGQVTGSIIAVSSNETFRELWSSFQQLVGTVSILVLVLTLFAASIVTTRLTKPIKEMAIATRRLAQGDYDVRVKTTGEIDEVSELAQSFNFMANSLQETERQRKDLIANISHELKTPMTTISGYTDGMLDGTIPMDQSEKYLRIISTESHRLSQMVRRILNISQLQSLSTTISTTPFDLGERMRQVLISLEQRINERHLDVKVDIPDDPVMVKGDKDLITQVIYNLIENASKFATIGSTLVMTLAVSNGKAFVNISNQGKTISPEELPLLFERFHKSDASRSEDKDGFGLGLYIVRTILDQHHEKIAVTSENGLTTFSFSLPLA